MGPLTRIQDCARSLAWIFAISIFSFSVVTSAQDAMDANFQKRVSRIYADTKPVSSEEWHRIVGRRKEDVYITQPGDTLAKISQTLFGDTRYWSKLWAENPQLENPNALVPGSGLRLVSGDEAAAPRAEVVTPQVVKMIRLNAITDVRGRAPTYRQQALKDIKPEEIFDQNTIEVDELVNAPELPPYSFSSKVLTVLPPSFVAKKIKNLKRYDSTGLDIGDRSSYMAPAIVIPNSYLADAPPESIGRVSEVETQENVASIGQNVFLKLEQEEKIGQRLSVIYPKKMIKDKDQREYGPVVEIEGIVEIFEIVDAEQYIYRAQVVKAVNPIRKNAQVTEKTLPRGTFLKKGTRVNVEARVIGGEFDENRTQLGSSSVVYLDEGSDSGLSPGDILPVSAKRSSRHPESAIGEWRRPIGLLKIVKVEATVSTAFVMQSTEEIKPGDRTGGQLPETARPINEVPLEMETGPSAKSSVDEDKDLESELE